MCLITTLDYIKWGVHCLFPLDTNTHTHTLTHKMRTVFNKPKVYIITIVFVYGTVVNRLQEQLHDLFIAVCVWFFALRHI